MGTAPMDVIAPVIVAALGNGNDILFVINTVSDDATGRREQPTIVHGVEHADDVVPVHDRGYDHGRDHVPG